MKKYSQGTFVIYTVAVEKMESSDSVKKYMKDTEIDDVTSLEGEFTVIGQFLIQEYNTKEFVSDQLINRELLKKRGVETSGKAFHPLLYSKAKNETI